MKMSYNVYIMTYGSLMNGFHNHIIMDYAEGQFIGKAKTVESRFDMVSMGGYPGIIPGNKKFVGELYSVSMDNVIKHLDYLEGYPEYYDRIPVKVECNGKEYNALVYVLSKETIKSTDTSNKNRVFESEGCYSWTK